MRWFPRSTWRSASRPGRPTWPGCSAPSRLRRHNLGRSTTNPGPRRFVEAWASGGSRRRLPFTRSVRAVPEIRTTSRAAGPLYSPDYDGNYPPEANTLKDAIHRADAVLFVTPEYNRSIPGALKNAIDWAARPWGHNCFDHIPAAVIGASIGQIGTALAQQSLRAVLSFCNARQMTAPEAYIQYPPEIFPGDGQVKMRP
ncbi:MAG TPA: NADPH-dependent FMN reductase [Actinoplanes sp.]|nr:NADPH-dependent FMN reductase [Actinoplanes sp.]